MLVTYALTIKHSENGGINNSKWHFFFTNKRGKSVFTPSILGLQKTELFTEAFIANCFKEKPGN